jgi:hypothetical protein
MRKAQIAEWILKLFTTPERAASAIGDMVEEAHGALRFWISVVRTVFSFIWRDISADPLYMAGLAIRAWLLSAALVVGFILALIIPAIPIVGILVGAGILNEKSLDPPSIWITAVGWLVGVLFLFTIPYRVGRWVARRAPGREIAACVALQIVPFILINILAAFVEHFLGAALTAWTQTLPAQNTPEVPTGLSWIVGQLPSFIAVMVAAIQVRRRAAQIPIA